MEIYKNTFNSLYLFPPTQKNPLHRFRGLRPLLKCAEIYSTVVESSRLTSCPTPMGVFSVTIHKCQHTTALPSNFTSQHVKLLRIPQVLAKIPIIYVMVKNRGLPPSFPSLLELGLSGTCEASLLPVLGYLLHLQRGQSKADVHTVTTSSQKAWVFSLT